MGGDHVAFLIWQLSGAFLIWQEGQAAIASAVDAVGGATADEKKAAIDGAEAALASRRDGAARGMIPRADLERTLREVTLLWWLLLW